MQLSKYKYIKNSRTLPKYDPGKTWDGVDISSTLKGPVLDTKTKLAEMDTKLAGMKFENPLKPKLKFDANKFASGFNKAKGIAGDALGAYSAISNAFNAPIKSGSEMNTEAGTADMSAGGATVKLQNQVDEAAQMAQLKKENQSNSLAAASSGAKLGGSVGSLLGPVGGVVGSVVGGIGGFIGGLFGGSSRKRRMRERLARMRSTTNLDNDIRVVQGVSDRMTSEYAEDHENTQDDILYANNGKSAMRQYNNGKVWSPNGYHAGPTNSKVGYGESIVNFRTGKGTLITKGRRGVDNQDSSVSPGDDNTIFGNMINPYSGMLFSDQAAPLTMQLEHLNAIKLKNKGEQSSLTDVTQKVQQRELNKAKRKTLGQLQELADQQQQVHAATGNGEYNNGKVPMFDDGDDGIAYDRELSPITALGRRRSMQSPFNPPVESPRLRDLSEIDNMAFLDIPTGRWDAANISAQAGERGLGGTQYSGMTRSLNRALRNERLAGPDVVPTKPTSSASAAAVSETMLPALEPIESKGSSRKSKKSNFLNSLGNLFKSNSQGGLGDYHTLPGIASLLAGYNQYMRAESQAPKGSDIYAINPYERLALQGLSRQRLNPYNYMRDMYDAERRGAYAINNAGAMSGGQRQANRVALALGSQRNIADMLRNVDEKNLGYKQKYYDTMLSTGNQNATRRQSANQYDFDTYTKAHAAREQMRQMGINNMLQALGDYQKNRFKRDMGRQQLDLYNRSLSLDQRRLLKELENR